MREADQHDVCHFWNLVLQDGLRQPGGHQLPPLALDESEPLDVDHPETLDDLLPDDAIVGQLPDDLLDFAVEFIASVALHPL